ncbi:MAG: hypothetical protein IJL76_02980 [Bacilli bacterium]|nr:hypothetical protein [Bacilli bacterium]
MIELNDKTFILDDNKRYAVIESITYENKIYAYLVNVDDEMDSMFKEIVTDNNELSLQDIDKNLFRDKILNVFLDKFKDE